MDPTEDNIVDFAVDTAGNAGDGPVATDLDETGDAEREDDDDDECLPVGERRQRPLELGDGSGRVGGE